MRKYKPCFFLNMSKSQTLTQNETCCRFYDTAKKVYINARNQQFMNLIDLFRPTLSVMHFNERTSVSGLMIAKFGTRREVSCVFNEWVIALLPPLQLPITPCALRHILRSWREDISKQILGTYWGYFQKWLYVKNEHPSRRLNSKQA